MGVWSSATDGYDPGVDVPASLGGAGFAGVYRAQVPEHWDGQSGFYHMDFQSVPGAVEQRSWDSLYVWAYPTYASETMHFSLSGRVARCGDHAARVTPGPTERRYLLQLLHVPAIVSGAPPVGAVWDLPLSGDFTLALPAYRSTNGLTGYRFSFTITEASTLMGDFDRNDDVDLDDYAVLVACKTGPGEVPGSGSVTVRACLNAFDSDLDGDVDERDFAEFQIVCNGGRP